MRHFIGRVALVASLFVIPSSAFATSYVVPTDRDMIGRSDAIIIGTALGSYCQVASYGQIETVTTFSIEEVIKGQIETSQISVHEPGGRLGARVKFFAGVPVFNAGERVLLMLKKTPQGTWASSELALGNFHFVTGRNGDKLLLRDAADINGWAPDLTPYHEQRRLAAPFLDFVRTESKGGVGTNNYVDAKPLEASTKAASLTPATNAASTSPSSYLGFFTAGGARSRVNTFPTAMTYFSSNTGVNPTAATAAVNAAVTAWSTATGSNANLVNGGADPGPSAPAGASGSFDGRNSVRFEVDLALIGAGSFTCNTSSFSGLLGIGGPNNGGASYTGPAGETFLTLTEGDVDMNKNVLGCSLAASLVPSAVTHEVGHSIGFRHADKTAGADGADLGPCVASPTNECSTNSIMTAFVTNSPGGALLTWDQNAVKTVYPGSAPAPTAPAAPTNLAVTANPNDLALTWSGTATNETGQSLYTSLNGAAFVKSATTFAAGQRSATLTGFGAGSWSFRLTSFNAVGESAPSNTVTFTISIPAAPTALAVTVNPTNLALTWSGTATNEAGQSLYTSLNNAPFVKSTTTFAAGQRSATLSGFVAGSWRIYLTSFNSAGESGLSNTVSFTVTVSQVVKGDANGDGNVTVSDVFYLINNLFAGGPPAISGDANGDGTVTVADVFYLINFLFAGGPAPKAVSPVVISQFSMGTTSSAAAPESSEATPSAIVASLSSDSTPFFLGEPQETATGWTVPVYMESAAPVRGLAIAVNHATSRSLTLRPVGLLADSARLFEFAPVTAARASYIAFLDHALPVSGRTRIAEITIDKNDRDVLGSLSFDATRSTVERNRDGQPGRSHQGAVNP